MCKFTCLFLFVPLSFRAQEKRNLALLGALLLVVAVVVSSMDFEVLEEAFEAL